MDAFDADVLIYAAKGNHRGIGAKALLAGAGADGSCIGSVLLLPEVLSHPIRFERDAERLKLEELLVLIDLKPVDYETAVLAAELGAKYGLRGADSVHLATAVAWGADRFHTNNSKDFGQHIDEIEVVLSQV